MSAVVVVEDDLHIRQAVARVLADMGHDVVSAGAALAGLEAVVQRGPDLVLLDLGLPDLDGTELLKMIRAVSTVPVIVITARNEDAEVVRTLDSGADDYLVKPFTTAQLGARVRAVLRRHGEAPARQALRVGNLEIDPPARTATLDGAALTLSPKEFDLLLYLARRAGEVVTKREMLAEVWREPYGGSERTVDVHLSWLRRKMGETAAAPRYLQTVFGVGIRLVDPSS
ncbi:MAG TPA: response regulator transcription factor [Acidimicrobiia bacterium]|nr:response regulator transcription factor [Acidimicrobiia bacterium]